MKIDDEPGEYIMHWYWSGYSDCQDIAVLPNDPAAGTVVPDTSESKYGVLGTTAGYSRIDHCMYGGGRLQVLSFVGIAPPDGHGRWAPILGNGKCSDIPIEYDPRASKSDQQTSEYRMCYVIPPEGKRNALNETRQEALAMCFAICDNHQGPQNRCTGVNVVPLQPPPATIFKEEGTCNLRDGGDCVGTTTGDRAIPFGVSNCDASCFAKEPHPAESMVCYPVRRVARSARGTRSLTHRPFITSRDHISSLHASLRSCESARHGKWRRTGLSPRTMLTMRSGTQRATSGRSFASSAASRRRAWITRSVHGRTHGRRTAPTHPVPSCITTLSSSARTGNSPANYSPRPSLPPSLALQESEVAQRDVRGRLARRELASRRHVHRVRALG